MDKLVEVTNQDQEWVAEKFTHFTAQVMTAMLGVKDRGGNPYFEHLVFVAEHQDTPVGELIGLMHDMLEDGHVTVEELRTEWEFPESVICRIQLLSKPEGMPYADYIDRVCTDTLCMGVKLYDLTHNLNLARLYRKAPLKASDLTRINNYLMALQKIASHLEISSEE